jgi:hypothetical protein
MTRQPLNAVRKTIGPRGSGFLASRAGLALGIVLAMGVTVGTGIRVLAFGTVAAAWANTQIGQSRAGEEQLPQDNPAVPRARSSEPSQPRKNQSQPEQKGTSGTSGTTEASTPGSKPKSTSSRVPLNPEQTVFLDAERKVVELHGEVCLRDGVLEMLACLKGKKEHESIISIETQAKVVHAGLLALGAQPGQPVQYMPEYRSPTGTRIQIFVRWIDDKDIEHRIPAQQWVQKSTRRYWVEKLAQFPTDLVLSPDDDLRWDKKHSELFWYGPMSKEQLDRLVKMSNDPQYRTAIQSLHAQSQTAPLSADWVFAGSSWWKDERTGEELYQAEGGDLICVANFSTATLDLAFPSSSQNSDLLFEAATAHIPPVGTKVVLELQPVLEESVEPASSVPRRPPAPFLPEPADTPAPQN